MPPKKKQGNKGGSGKKEKFTWDEEEQAKPQAIDDEPVYKATPWTGSGNLESLPLNRDVKIGKFSVSLQGVELVKDTTLELNHGRRYGLIGLNGSGKSTMMRVLGERQVPIPPACDIYHLTGEVDATDLTALEAVVEGLKDEVARLEKLAEELNLKDPEEEGVQESLQEIYERIDHLDPATATARAGKILSGLGFTKQTQEQATKDFSGGWRMRIALAKALFVSPALLLLDEPTNHLDLEACIWLEEYLKNYKRILVIISHSQDFMNGVCTNIIHLQRQVLKYYGGNYDTYITTRGVRLPSSPPGCFLGLARAHAAILDELEEHQMKQYTREQAEIAHMKDYIARFGHGSAKLARQAQSKEKTLARMVEGGLTEKVISDKIFTFSFLPCGNLPPPVLMFNEVSFGYNDKKLLYQNLDFGVDLDSRIALVGPNGAGKSTLLKLMVGDILPTHGMVRAHQHLRMGRYHQHLQDALDVDLSPLDFLKKEFPDLAPTPEIMRQQIGRFGLTGPAQTLPIKYLSDGQKSRVIIAWIALQRPHILLLDEPTNHLDLETIDSLAAAINAFEGGLVLVSHDFRLIGQVCEEIWECKDGRVKKWDGDIISYKNKLKEQVMAENNF